MDHFTYSYLVDRSRDSYLLAHSHSLNSLLTFLQQLLSTTAIMECMREQFQEGAILDGRYQLLSPLNRGAYGIVMLAKDLEKDERVAIKCLTKATASEDPAALPEGDHHWELQCHELLGSHPGLVQLFHSFESEAHVFLVLEFCSNGDLFEAIRCGRGPCETERVRSFMMQLVDCVEHMHSKGLYHRDIKPENIFLTQSGQMKLGDFGLATRESWSYHVGVGTERYMAPEQYDPGETGYSTAKADIWAVGITLINVIFGRNLFDIPAESDVHFADYLRNPESLFDKYPTMTADTFEVLVHALAIDPERRSLEAFRAALTRVESFTTDDEELDFFCVGHREIVPVSANRQPLPTPSVKKEGINGDGQEFWTNLLRTTSPTQHVGHLSAIADVTEATPAEETVPGLESYKEDELVLDDPHSSSLASVSHVAVTPSVGIAGDSGLGGSLASIDLHKPDEAPLSATVEPVSVSRPKPIIIPSLSSVFGRKGNSVSKSWYDICDEDDEELAEEERLRASVAVDAKENIHDKQVDEEFRSVSLPTAAALERKVSPKMEPAQPVFKPIHSKPSMFGLDGADDRGSEYSIRHSTRTFLPRSRYSPPFGFDGGDERESKHSTDHPTGYLRSRNRYSPTFGFDGIEEREHPNRTFMSKGRYISPRPNILEKWAELGKRRRAFDGSAKEGAVMGTHGTGVNDGGVGGDIGHDEGGFGRKGGQNQKPYFYDQSSTDDLEWVGGWHHIE